MTKDISSGDPFAHIAEDAILASGMVGADGIMAGVDFMLPFVRTDVEIQSEEQRSEDVGRKLGMSAIRPAPAHLPSTEPKVPRDIKGQKLI